MTELHAVLFVKQLLQEANTPVQKLWDEGNECFAKQDYDHALQKYQEAIKICEEHDFEKDLAVLTCNMAAVHLKLNNFKEALECSNKSLERNPKYFEVCTFKFLHVFFSAYMSKLCISPLNYWNEQMSCIILSYDC